MEHGNIQRHEAAAQQDLHLSRGQDVGLETRPIVLQILVLMT